jgi:hypothetical protein
MTPKVEHEHDYFRYQSRSFLGALTAGSRISQKATGSFVPLRQVLIVVKISPQNLIMEKRVQVNNKNNNICCYGCLMPSTRF